MASVACPAWEYRDVPECGEVLRIRSAQIIRAIYVAEASSMIRLLRDTRPVHRMLFAGLSPAGFEYYAGNYRGSWRHICLRDYKVGVQGDPRVGHDPGIVSRSMAEFVVEIDDTLKTIDQVFRISDSVLTRAEKLVRCVQLAAAIFVYFLEIHPFANGNGHMARLILISTMRRRGFFLRKWTLDPRPQDPPYTGAIEAYRSGNRTPLEKFILSCL